MYTDTNPPTHCPNNHQLGPRRVLVGWDNLHDPQIAPYVVGVALLFPFIVSQVQPLVQWVAERIAANSYLARGQTVQEIMGLGTRDIIWTESTSFWAANVGSLQRQLLGYGYNGHAKSGAALHYREGIGDFLTSPTALTMHNSALQTLFDAGLLGAGCLIVAIVMVTRRYTYSSEQLPMFAIVLMLGLSTAGEVTLAPGFIQTSVFVFLYLAVFSPTKASAPHKSEPKTQLPTRQTPTMANRSGSTLIR